MKYSVENSIQIIKDIGYERVEILCDRPHAFPLDDEIAWKEEINSIKKAISKANLPISNLNAFSMRGLGDAGDVFRPSWIESEAEKRELRINYTKECIKLAKRLGAKSISTEPGGLVSESSHTSEPLKDFINGLKTIIPVAEEHDVKILVEPTPGFIIENSKQFDAFLGQVNSTYVGLNFDIGHFYCMNEDPSELVRDHHLSYLEHFHIEDIAKNRVHNHLIPGQGSIDFRSVLRSIMKKGYDGYLTVELHTNQPNPEQAAKISYNYLSRVRRDLST